MRPSRAFSSLLRPLLTLCLLTVIVLGTAGDALAQGGDDPEACPAIVEAALTFAGEACQSTPRNDACYGHLDVAAIPGTHVTEFHFDQPGDLAYVGDLAALQLGPMDTLNRTWGVSIMRLAANLTRAEHSVTMILFGGVQVTNAVAELPTVPVTANAGVNIRQHPSTDSAIVGMLAAGETTSANGRTSDGLWLRVELPEHHTGWIFGRLLTVDGDSASLDITDSAATQPLTPMQAFYLESGFAEPLCEEAAPDGILIQTPPDTPQQVALVINDAEILLGSTAFIRAERDGVLRIYLVEGHAEVTAAGETVTLPAGSYTDVPLAGLSASAPPTEPESYQDEDVTPPLLILLETVSDPAENDGLLAGIADNAPCTVAAINNVNLRGGPGTHYTNQGQLLSGQHAQAAGSSQGIDGYLWWQLTSGLWLRSDLVETAGACGSVPTVAATPIPPTAVPVVNTGADANWGSSNGNMIHYTINFCTGAYNGLPISAGDTVRFGIGIGRWPSVAEAEAALAGHSASISVDGVQLPVTYQGITWHDSNPSNNPGYGNGVNALWIATPGTHTVTGHWTTSSPESCTFTVG